MNKVILIGRATKDADVRRTEGAQPTAIARFSLAVDRRFKKEGQQDADFINMVAFGKTAEFCEKYARKGVKFAVEGRIQTGSYKNKEGQTIYTTDVVIENIEFAESKKSEAEPKQSTGFMDIPDGIGDELPFE